MKKRVRSAIILLLITAAIVALLYYSLRGVEFARFREHVANADYRYALLAVLATLGVFVVKAVRWQILMNPVKRVGLYPLFAAIMIGFMANCIISRVGEVIRAAVLGVKGEARTSTALGTIAVERVFDTASVVLFLVIGILSIGSAAGRYEQLAALRAAGYGLAAALIIGVGALVALWLWPDRMERLALATTRVLPGKLREKVAGFIKSFMPGLRALQSLRQVLALAGLSVIHWAVQVLMFWWASHCLAGHGPFPLSFQQSCLVMALTALGVAALPLPGFVGIFQGGVTAAMVLLGADLNAANVANVVAAYGIIAWLANIPPIVAVGFVFLWTEGIGMRELRREGKNDECRTVDAE